MIVTIGFGLEGEGAIQLPAFTADMHDAAGDNMMFEMSNQYTLRSTTAGMDGLHSPEGGSLTDRLDPCLCRHCSTRGRRCR